MSDERVVRLQRDDSPPLRVEMFRNFHTVKVTYDGEDPEMVALRLIQLAHVILNDPLLAERLAWEAQSKDFLLFNINSRKEWRHDSIGA